MASLPLVTAFSAYSVAISVICFRQSTRNLQKISDQDSDADIRESEDKFDSKIEENAYNLQCDLSAPAIDLPISREGVYVEDLAVFSAAKFSNAQLTDPDLVLLRKWLSKRNCRLLRKFQALVHE